MKMHTHHKHEQSYFILEAEGIVRLGDEQRKAKAGNYAYLRIDIPHGLANESDQICKMFSVGANIFKPFGIDVSYPNQWSTWLPHDEAPGASGEPVVPEAPSSRRVIASLA